MRLSIWPVRSASACSICRPSAQAWPEIISGISSFRCMKPATLLPRPMGSMNVSRTPPGGVVASRRRMRAWTAAAARARASPVAARTRPREPSMGTRKGGSWPRVTLTRPRRYSPPSGPPGIRGCHCCQAGVVQGRAGKSFGGGGSAWASSPSVCCRAVTPNACARWMVIWASRARTSRLPGRLRWERMTTSVPMPPRSSSKAKNQISAVGWAMKAKNRATAPSPAKEAAQPSLPAP